jgi:hypothetical protein
MSIHVQFGFNQPYGENVSKRFFSETTWTIETKLPRNDHWKVLYNFYVFYADRGIKNIQFVEDLPMIIPGQFGFNCPSGFREEAFWNNFSIGSNVVFYADRFNPRWSPPQYID